MTRPSAYLEALHLLSRRELSVAECRSRLLDRQHSEPDIERAIEHLLETGGLDDARLARTYAQTAAESKGRGRLRVVRELVARGIDRELAAEVVGTIFGEKDERALVSRAIQKKLRGGQRPANRAAFARLYQHLMRQGFTPAVISEALRKLGRREDEEVQ